MDRPSSRRSASPFVDLGFAMVRTPLLPFSTFADWSGAPEAATASPAQLEAAISRDTARLRAGLRSLFSRPALREALFVASPDLEASVPEWERDPGSERGAKVERALLRYLGRMTARATPFGLFAGYSLASVGEVTSLSLGPAETWRRHTRLDMDVVCELAGRLEAEPGVKRHLSYRPNTSLYVAGGRLRYLVMSLVDKQRRYTLVSAERSTYLESTLELARAGAPLEALALALERGQDVSKEEAVGFVEELVSSQLLVSDLAPLITGIPATEAMVQQLRRIPGQEPRVDALEAVTRELAAIDACGVSGVAPAVYRAAATRLEALPLSADLQHLFQVDLEKGGSGLVLGREAIDGILAAVQVLARLCASHESQAMEQFIKAFEKRYEGRELPLLEVLDEEIGIGFDATSSPASSGTPALAALPFRGPAAVDGAHRTGRQYQLLLEKLLTVRPAENEELVLSDADLAVLSGDAPLPLPDSFFAWATLIAGTTAEIDAGRARVLMNSVIGPSGASFLGRFCASDPALATQVRAVLAAEEALRPEVIFAEIAHFPEGRVGNVLARPSLRAHEISYLGRGGCPPEGQIAVSDLLVSVRDGRVVLHSKRLGKEVQPRLTTAHNYAPPHNVGVYRFLCMIQQQGVRTLQFRWGSFESAPWLPRLVAGRVVVALARWNLKRRELERLDHDTPTERYAAVQALRRELFIPRFVSEVDGDNAVPIDLDNPLMADAFCQKYRKRAALRLDELYPLSGSLCVSGPEGAFRHEALVPFSRKVTIAPATSRCGPPTTAPRSFPPGSSWLYAKLYCGEASADSILQQVVVPAAHRAIERGAARQWFFIRYGDPDFHLRVRFEGDPARLAAEVLPLIHELGTRARADGRLWRVQFDTYEPEVERYGGPAGMGLAERFFHLDSELAVRLLPLFEGPGASDRRWRLATRGVAEILEALRFDLETRRRLVRKWREGFGREFRVERTFEAAIAARHRAERSQLEALLGEPGEGDDPLSQGLRLIIQHRPVLEAWARDLFAAEKAGALSATVEELAFSFGHMHANRMIHAAARAHELLIADALNRIYSSRLARSR